jgi:hypothetical protein
MGDLAVLNRVQGVGSVEVVSGDASINQP